MKGISLQFSLLCALCLVVEAVQLQSLQPDSNFHLYLLIGQSNMAGRGALETNQLPSHPHVLMFTKELNWQPAKDPLHFDKPAAGVGPGLSFGESMATAFPSAKIGLVPCAVGGTSIHAWLPNAEDKATKTHPYDDMLKRMREAQRFGVLKGIIWHQGESDRKNDTNYSEELTSLVVRLRQDLHVSEVPFVAGELTVFNQDNQAATEHFNNVLHGLTNTIPYYACASGTALADKGDHLHYSSASARILGQRYAEKMLELQRLKKPSH